jgi:hypothetical protein
VPAWLRSELGFRSIPPPVVVPVLAGVDPSFFMSPRAVPVPEWCG